MSEINDKFWAERSNLHVCWEEYEGPRVLALTDTGCLKQVSPPRPTPGDVPILLDGCVDNLQELKTKLYGAPKCSNMTLKAFDVESVQLKLDGEQVLLYCPLQHYQFNGEPARPCPIREVVPLPITANVTVLRHPQRAAPERQVLRYVYNSIIHASNTTLRLPEKIKIIYPNLTQNQTTDIASLREALDKALAENHNHKRRAYNVVQLMKRKGTKWWGSLIKYGGVIAIGIIILFAIGLILRDKAKQGQPPVYPANAPREETPLPTLITRPAIEDKKFRFVQYVPESEPRRY